MKVFVHFFRGKLSQIGHMVICSVISLPTPHIFLGITMIQGNESGHTVVVCVKIIVSVRVAWSSYHNGNMFLIYCYIICGYFQHNTYNTIRLLYLDVRKMMPNSLSQPVVRPLCSGGAIVLHGTHHHLHGMLVDALTRCCMNN